MNYTELKAKIADVTENTFSEDAYQIFVALAEERIYSSADLPVLRKNSTGTLTTSNQYLSVPADYRYTYSLAVISAAGVLLNACLLEAARFMKAEEDIVNLYNEMYGQSLLLLKNLADGKLRGDTYRSGQPKKAVK